jgi:hypothetical protein
MQEECITQANTPLLLKMDAAYDAVPYNFESPLLKTRSLDAGTSSAPLAPEPSNQTCADCTPTKDSGAAVQDTEPITESDILTSSEQTIVSIDRWMLVLLATLVAISSVSAG